MESEIREQPSAMERCLASIRRVVDSLRGKRFEMALIAARGSSDNAALYARYLIEIHLGIPVSLAAPSVLTRYNVRLRFPACLAIGISQSGAAPDVSEVLEYMRDAGHETIAITNTPNSRVTESSKHTLLLDAGPEKSVAATKTYTASLLALYELVRSLGGAGLEAPDPFLVDDSWINTCNESASASFGAVVRSNPVFALARGYEFATAQETALKLMECALLPCKAYSIADFEHGPKALAGPGSALVGYEALSSDISAQGTDIVRAPKVDPSVPEPLRPLRSIVFGQFLALCCARGRGLDPDQPRFIRKVTETL